MTVSTPSAKYQASQAQKSGYSFLTKTTTATFDGMLEPQPVSQPVSPQGRKDLSRRRLEREFERESARSYVRLVCPDFDTERKSDRFDQLIFRSVGAPYWTRTSDP